MLTYMRIAVKVRYSGDKTNLCFTMATKKNVPLPFFLFFFFFALEVTVVTCTVLEFNLPCGTVSAV